MANPIKASALFLNDGTFRTAREELLAMREAYQLLQQDARKGAVKLKAEIQNVNVANAQGRQRLKEKQKETDKVKRAQQRYLEALSDTNRELKRVQDQTRKANRLATLETRLAKAKTGSYDALAAQYEINRIKLQALSEEERENTVQGQELIATTKALRVEMKRQKKEIDDNTLNVGNYSEAINQALANVSALPGATGAATQGVFGLGRSFKALLANPIVLLLSTIIGALGLLFDAFRRSEKGAELLAQGGAFLQGVYSGLIKVFEQAIDVIANFVSDPIQGIKDLGQAIFDNVIERVNNLIKGLGLAGEAIGKFLTGRFQEAAEAAKKGGEALFNAFSPVTTDNIKEFTEAIAENTKTLIESGNAFAALARRRLELRRSNRALAKSVEELNIEEAKFRGIADSNTLSFKQIQDAQEALIQVQEKRLAKEQQIARNNLELINTEIAIRRKNGEQVEDLLDSQVGAIQQLKAAERELIEAQLDNEEKRRQVIQDRLERDLDILIDGFDNQKTINEQRIRDENLTLEKRQEILDKTVALSDRSFAKQIDTIKAFTDVQFDANELINEQDATVLNERIRRLGLSEIIEGRLLEIVRDRKSAIQDLTVAQQDLNKAEKEQAKNLGEILAAQLEIRREQEENQLDQLLEFEEARFNIVERSEEELTKFRLEQERKRLEGILDINERLGGDLTDLQIKTIRAQVQAIDRELSKLNAGKGDIFDRLGFKFGDDEKGLIKESFNFVKDQFAGLLNTRIEQAEKAVELADTEVEAAREAYLKQIALAEEGRTNTAEQARLELQQAERNQERAQRQQERAQRAQLAAQSVQQTANLITATSKIFAQVGNPLFAIPLVGLMWSTFAAAKLRAFSATKTIFGEGGQGEIKGGSHKSGNDVFIGYTSSGSPMFAEGGEHWGIFSKRAKARYGSFIPDMIDAANDGTLERFFSVAESGASLPIVAGGHVFNANFGKSEEYLRKLATDQEQVYNDEKGNLVIKKGNYTRTYVN